AEAKRQLHEEADYLREARCQERFAGLLAGTPNLRIPAVHGDLTTETVLAMDYVECVPIESLQRAPQAQRDEVASTLMG
ncbi:AarF/UbiB family protein, partial [Acinetobacter baumannii]